MTLSDKALAEFKAIVKKDYNKESSDVEARELASRLLRLTRLVKNHTRKITGQTTGQFKFPQ